jgi:hypothetical protein
MELEALIRLMRTHFDISIERIEGEPEYKVRFIAPPYDSFVPGCKSIKIEAHNRGTLVSPLNIKTILAKFEITEDRFRDAYNYFSEGLPPRGAAN